MASNAALSRWLPTMLGGLLVVGVVMAYELELIEREPAAAPPCDCEAERPASKPAPRRDPFTAGARSRPDDDVEDDSPLATKLARLETQNALLAERNVTGEHGYYNLSPAELEAMARHCDVRSDYPKNLDAQEAEDLGLSAAEREAWTRALEAFAAQELELYRGLLREIDPATPGLDDMPLAQVRRQLSKVASRAKIGDDDSLQRHVAEERAGLREAPEDPAALSAWNRYNRLRFNAGDRFAALLAAELGDDRAHELRSVFDGWPGARSRQWGCPGEDDG